MTLRFHANHVLLKICIFLLFFFVFPFTFSIASNQIRNPSIPLSKDIRDQFSKAFMLSVSDKFDDKKKAFKIYSSLAAKGISESYYFLGHYYSTENKVTSLDYKKAMYFYIKSAEAGDKNAASTLATFYAIGVLGEKDYASAAKWYEKSIAMGNKSDLLKLGYFYQNGYGVKRDYDKALSLYKEALAFDIVDSQHRIDELAKIIKTKNMLYGRIINRIVNATFFDYLTIASFALAIVFYLKSRKDKILRYDIRTFNIIKNSINKYDLLSVEYDGHKIDNLTISKVAIWNAGKESIRSTDIPKSSPFLINATDGIILSSNVITQNNEANMFGCTISDDRSSVLIDFDFIDYDNTAIIEILHTSNTLSVSGCVIGGKGIFKSSFSKLSPLIRRKAIVGLFTTTAIFVIADIAAIYNYNDIVKSDPELIIIIYLVILALSMFCLLLISGCISLLRSMPMSGFDSES